MPKIAVVIPTYNEGPEILVPTIAAAMAMEPAHETWVRDDGERTLLFDLDMAIVRLRQQLGDHASVVALTGVYHNLLRQWAEM